jgi:hypothetical protein
MIVKKSVQGLLLICALYASSTAQAATHVESINGAHSCISDSRSGWTSNHWFIGFGGLLNCHLDTPNDFLPRDISRVFFSAQTFGAFVGTFSARLCVHSGTWTVTCGPAKNIGLGYQFSFVELPMSVPSFAIGAFVQFTLPPSPVYIYDITPEWSK